MGPLAFNHAVGATVEKADGLPPAAAAGAPVAEADAVLEPLIAPTFAMPSSTVQYAMPAVAYARPATTSYAVAAPVTTAAYAMPATSYATAAPVTAAAYAMPATAPYATAAQAQCYLIAAVGATPLRPF